MPHIFGKTDVDRMVFLYLDLGWSLRRISEEMHCSRHTIGGYLRARGLTLRSRGGGTRIKLDYDELKRIAYCYTELELSLHEIGRRFGLPPATVRYRLQAFGVPLRTASKANELAWKQHRESILRKRRERGYKPHGNIKRLQKGL